MHVCICGFMELAYSIMTYNETQRNIPDIAHLGYVWDVLRKVLRFKTLVACHPSVARG